MQHSFIHFSTNFCEYIRMENKGFKNENNERKYSENMRNNQFLSVRNSILELEKDFMELTDRELKNSKEKNKREIEELLQKPIIVSKEIM